MSIYQTLAQWFRSEWAATIQHRTQNDAHSATYEALSTAHDLHSPCNYDLHSSCNYDLHSSCNYDLHS